jgi:site-specific DNA recombinase
VTQPTRFAFYGRVSTVDKQDPTLSFPSQERACQAKARELGGEIVCVFTDQASGTTADRPGWSALVVEARQPERRFDGVICFSTSRLARDLVMAGLFERELRHAGVGITTSKEPGTHRRPRAGCWSHSNKPSTNKRSKRSAGKPAEA